MAVIRLIILVAVLGGLTLLLAQNFSPALPLVFLGTRTQPFPLAMWLLFSTVAGAVTSLIVNILFGFAGYFTQSKQKYQASSRASYRKDTQRRDSQTPNTQYKSTAKFDQQDDWDLDSTSEDWDFEDTQRKSANQEKQDRRVSDEEMYSSRQTTNSSKADTSYSYSSREPKNSGVGKTESVYDADYRVIVPPYNSDSEPERPSTPPPKKQSSDDDDWSFFDEDNEKDDK